MVFLCTPLEPFLHILVQTATLLQLFELLHHYEVALLACKERRVSAWLLTRGGENQRRRTLLNKERLLALCDLLALSVLCLGDDLRLLVLSLLYG